MYRAVLIEDEDLLREGLFWTTPWAEHGFEVVGCAGDAVEGERMILEARPDLVITDIRLPKVSGLDMIESLTEKIMCDYIIISGYDEFQYARRAISLGVREYLLKPIDDAELLLALDKLREHIARRKEIETAMTRPDAPGEPLPTEKPAAEKSLGDRYIDAALDYITRNFAKNITVRSVADALLISESYLTKLFKRKTDRSFLDTLTMFRMREALRLLEETGLKVYEIANRLGYQDTQYFSTLFRKFAGVSPSEYKRGH